MHCVVSQVRLSAVHKALIVVAVLIALRATGITSTAAWQQRSRTVTVDYVFDGDTFETSQGERVRLLGIDAPEVARRDSEGEPFGDESTDWLRRAIDGKRVSLTFDERQKDHYGRTLAWVWLDDQMINEASLRNGQSRLEDKFGLPIEFEERLRRAEAEAQVRDLGMWE